MHRFTQFLFPMRTALLAVALIAGATALAGGVEALFLAENNAAIAKMMAAMDVKPSGDVDADFVATMVPHHQAAIDMAQAQLRYGRNEQLRRIARQIVATQQQEIAAMQLAVGHPLPPCAQSPDHAAAAPTGTPHSIKVQPGL